MIRGLSTTTPSKLLLGVGAFYKNFTIGTDTPATASSKLLGATDGGGTVAIVPQIRQVSVDGAPGDVKGLKVNDGYTATMTINLKEVTLANLELALGAFSTISTATNQTQFRGKHEIVDADYATNIVWAGTISGSSEPVYIEFDNVLSVNGLNLTVSDKNEATIPVTLTAHYALSDLDTPPFKIVYPSLT